ncbi:MAG: hypothetical protein JJ900_18310 [Rhodospirillales bacterium]|nr:hypothetical protein [Rhodospirillales bacterium]MBO6788806.1 hypothetical protein [Rhodospirillales bacterium]
MPRIGIITGVKSEEAALAPIMGSVEAPYVRLSGARPARARAGVEALIGLGVDALVSFGSVGAVSPDQKPGDLLVGTSVLDDDGGRYTPDEDWSARIADVSGARPATVIGIDYIAHARDKARFAAQDIAGIDMESHCVAKLAGEAGVPFAVLRAVVDPYDFEFPDYVLDAVRPDGSISLLPVIAGVATQPWTIGRLLDLNRFNKSAMESLGGAARVLGPGLGFFTL